MTMARWTRGLDVHWRQLLDLHKPTAEQILERYLLKFSKGGKATADKLHEHDLGLLDPVHEDGEGYVVQAGSN